jgi:hypothetical protein
MIRIFCLLVLALPLSAQKTYTLQDALKQELIAVRVVAEGGHSGQSLTLLVDKLCKKSIEVLIPAGQAFDPELTDVQTLVNVHEEILVLDTDKKKKRIFALCAEASDRSPSSDVAFAVGVQITGPLAEIVRFINKNKLHTHPEAQYAVWVATNQYEVASIHHRALLEATCKALNLAVPDYRIFQASGEATPGQVALQYIPTRIEGRFEFKAETDQTLNVFLVNEAGERVRTLIPDRPYKAGSKHKFSYTFETSKLAFGKYHVCLYANDLSVECKEVRF